MAEIIDPLDTGGWGSGGGRDDPYAYDAGSGETQGGGGSGHGTGPPTGANELQVVYTGLKFGVPVKIWTKGNELAIRVGRHNGENVVQFWDFSNGNLVDAVARAITWIEKAHKTIPGSGLL